MALDNYEGDATELLETYGPLSEQFQHPAVPAYISFDMQIFWWNSS